jgi:molybdopterin-guanine dinucleotide biosynthesis protein A
MCNRENFKAIVVAGDKGKCHPVFGKNKAFLEVEGLPIIVRVVMTLGEAESVSEIYVVGPKQRLDESFLAANLPSLVKKPVYTFDQRATLYENVWSTFLETLPSYQQGYPIEKIADGPDQDEVVLVVAGDMPLLTPSEIDEFVSKCDMEKYDYVVGMTMEDDLKYYYPRDGRKGIRLAYMHFKEGNYRQNNMHMVRPLKIHNRRYVQTMYDLRYQKEFGNIIRLTWEILKREEGGWRALGYYFLLQLSLLFARLRLGFLRDMVRQVTHTDSVIKCISGLLKTRVGYAFTSLGGSALDVDREREYEAIKVRFSDWMNFQRKKMHVVSARIGSA